MSWRKTVDENTLKFDDNFLRDLYAIREEICFDPWDDSSEEAVLAELRDWLFDEDHMEWTGNWLYNEKAQKVIEKHKLTGHVIFMDEVGGVEGFKFVDGKLVSTNLKLTFVDGEI